MYNFYSTKRKLVQTIVIATTLSLGLRDAAVHASEYVVRAHDTLLEILYRENFTPLYGPKGAWLQALRLNPELPSRGNFILPGQTIILPSGFRSPAEALDSVARSEPIVLLVQENEDSTTENDSTTTGKSAVAPVIETKFSATQSSGHIKTKQPIETEPSPALSSPSPSPSPTYPPIPSLPSEWIEWTAGLQFSQYQLNATDDGSGDRAQLYSNLSPGIQLSSKVVLDSRNAFSIKVSGEQIAFPSSASVRVLENAHSFKTAIEGRYWRGLTSTLNTSFALGFIDQYYLRPSSNGNIRIDKTSPLRFQFGLTNEFHSSARIKILGSLNISAILPHQTAGYSTQLGYEFEPELKWQMTRNSLSRDFWGAGFFGNYRRQDSSLHNATWSGGGIRFEYSIGTN
ncbi:MAG: hypothetical protein EOP04_16205 [Proteobacteria bacterium]|nr:MAG: hypothetical protein EOP04_16205 [Pseudomonadota bacterium]